MLDPNDKDWKRLVRRLVHVPSHIYDTHMGKFVGMY